MGNWEEVGEGAGTGNAKLSVQCLLFFFLGVFIVPQMDFVGNNKVLRASETSSETGFKFKRCLFSGNKYGS